MPTLNKFKEFVIEKSGARLPFKILWDNNCASSQIKLRASLIDMSMRDW